MNDRRLLFAVLPIGALVGAASAAAVLTLSTYSSTWTPMPVDTSGMTPTWSGGMTRLQVQRDAYASVTEIARGDVVVYESAALDRYCLARVMGVPGDRVRIDGTTIHVNGERVSQRSSKGGEETPEIIETQGNRHYPITFAAHGLAMSDVEVGPDQVQLLPDNRTHDRQSCFGGLVLWERLHGRVE